MRYFALLSKAERNKRKLAREIQAELDRRNAEADARLARGWAPACDAIREGNGVLVNDLGKTYDKSAFKIEPFEPGVKVVRDPSKDPSRPTLFETTGASQWSTIDYVPPRPSKHLHGLVRKQGGQVVIDRKAIKEQVGHWKWLAQNPRLAYKVVQRSHREKVRLLDSALFL